MPSPLTAPRLCVCAIALLLAAAGPVLAEPSAVKVTAAITKQVEPVDEAAPAVVELVTIVPAPNKLSPANLKTPNGVTLASSSQNDVACAADMAQCRQRFTLNLDTRRNSCSLTGDYVLELQVSCQPGAAGQCLPGTASVPFKLAGSATPVVGGRGCAAYQVTAQGAGPSPRAWQQMPGAAADVGMGGGTLWAVGTQAVQGGFAVLRWDGKAWVPMNGGAVRLDVDAQGLAWVVTDKGEVFRHGGTAWSRLPGAARDIGVGANGAAWAIGTAAAAGGFEVFRWNNNGWQRVPGGGVRIDVDPQGNAWVVSDGGDVFRFTGAGWAPAPGVKARDIGVGGDGSVFVAAQDGGVHKWNGSAWVKRDGKLAELTVDAQGVPFGASDSQQIWMGYP